MVSRPAFNLYEMSSSLTIRRRRNELQTFKEYHARYISAIQVHIARSISPGVYPLRASVAPEVYLPSRCSSGTWRHRQLLRATCVGCTGKQIRAIGSEKHLKGTQNAHLLTWRSEWRPMDPIDSVSAWFAALGPSQYCIISKSVASVVN